MASGEMGEAEFTAFLARAFGLIADFSRDGSLHYIFMEWRHSRELLAAIAGRLFGMEEPVRLGQGQCRHGISISQPA